MTKKRKWLIAGGVALAAILLFCGWLFGWFRGDINMMRFSADEVDRIELSSTDVVTGIYRAVVTDKEEIQALIDSVNSFQHTGSGLKDIFKYGLFSGGTCLYDFHVYFTNGEDYLLEFGSHNGDQPRSDMEVAYWVYQEDKSQLFGYTCRGSMELFYELYEKYRPAGWVAP